MRCKSCDYSLAKLTEPRCPECGREFDPNDPSTFVSPLPARQLLGSGVMGGFLFVAFFALLTWLRYPLESHGIIYEVLLGIAMGAMALNALVLAPIVVAQHWRTKAVHSGLVANLAVGVSVGVVLTLLFVVFVLVVKLLVGD
jgi:hypothetical protein